MAFGFLKKAVKGIGKGLKAVGKVADKAAPALAFIPGIGTVAAGAIGGIGALASGKGIGGALKGFAKGAGGGLLKSGLSAIGGRALSGSGGLVENAMGDLVQEGGGGFLDKIKGFLGGGAGGLQNIGGLALGGLALKDARDQRASSEAFNQKLLDINVEQLAKAEAEFDRKSPLRDTSQAALLQAIQQQSGSEDSFSKFIRTSQGRAPGEFQARTGVVAPGPEAITAEGAAADEKKRKKEREAA